MTVREFINANRAKLVDMVLEKCENCDVGDDELEDHISNIVEIYEWALSEGVDV